MDKILTTGSNGICLFSLEVLQEFLKKEKIRTKKLLAFFQKDKKEYLMTQEKGIWIPFAQINSIKYLIKLEGYDTPFDEEWEEKFEYRGFNIEIKDGLWISDIGSLYSFNAKDFCGSEISYQTLDGNTIYSDFKYDVPAGKYLLSIKGYTRKEKLEKPNPNYGFLFSLVAVDEFSGFKNPREEGYDFNVAGM
ncbi:MAG: hypothetical protein IJN16_09895 [Lachnospiraceae bacterium]|nr:hypothetical protein [Lachnospiraceae bacterium]